ncbi:hypothetical protein BDP27DRAFT_1190999, partial [Rhodocollybia butyracea]
AEDLGDKYVLLHPTAQSARPLEDIENAALAKYLQDENIPTARAVHWGHLRLPNGQIARSYWKEKGKVEDLRMARNVKATVHAKPDFAEIQFYFRFQGNLEDDQAEPETLAMVSRYSKPDAQLLKDSFGTVISCKYQGADNLAVIPVKDIKSVVGMVPHS